MQILDISNYDVPFSNSTLSCFKSAGIEGLIVGCQRPAIAKTQIELAKNAGFKLLGTYCFLYWNEDTIGQTQTAIDIALEFGLRYVWIDCEDGGDSNATVSQRIEQLRHCVQMVESAGLFAGIYTGKFFWQDKMGNTTEFNRLPLWHAFYHDDRRLQQYVDYGGWETCSIHQYASSPELCGRNRDYDFVFDQKLIEDDAMTAEEKELLNNLLKAVFGSEDRMKFLMENNVFLENRVNSLEMNGDTVARKQLSELQENHGMPNHNHVNGEIQII